MPERRRVADLRAELGDVAIDHSLDVAVELRATNPRWKPADAGKPRGHDLGGVVAKANRGIAGDGRSFPAEKICQAHRRLVPAFRQRKRAHEQSEDASGAGVSARLHG